MNAATGAELWKYNTDGQVASSPAVVNGVVYIGSFDDSIYALGGSPTPSPSTSWSNTVFTEIGVVVAVVIVASVMTFLIFRKRLKTK